MSMYNFIYPLPKQKEPTRADTIDLLIATATTAPTGGKVRVWALMCDIGAKPAPGAVDTDVI